MTDFSCTAPSRTQPDPYKRVNYTLGLVLGVDEFDQEQNYFLERDRQHNREFHGYGTVCGLELSRDGTRVIVSPGMAIDPLGRVIRVNKEQCGDVNDWLSVPENTLQLGPANQPTQLYVVLCYQECQTDKVPIPGAPCRSEEESLDYSRVTETFKIEFQAVPPRSEEEELVRRFGALLNRIQITTSGSGPFLTADELADLVRGLLVIESPLPSPLPSPLSSPLSSPLDGVLWLRPEDAEAVLNRAFKVWVTEVRPQVAACSLNGILDDTCVLLGRATFNFEQTTSGPMVSGGQVEMVDDDRPILLHTRLLQEWLMRSLSGQDFYLNGDVQGSLDQTSIVRLQTKTVIADDPQETQVLTYSGGVWKPAYPPSVGTISLVGDVSGTPGANKVDAIKGVPIIPGTPGTGQFLGSDDGINWKPLDLPVMGNDVTGTLGDNKVVQMQGFPVSSAIPLNGQFLSSDGVQWLPQDLPALGKDVIGTLADNKVVRIQGVPVLDVPAPKTGQVLRFNGTQWQAQDLPASPIPGPLPGPIPIPIPSPAPLMAAAPIQPSYSFVAAGIIKASAVSKGLRMRTASPGFMLVTFDDYALPDGTFQYILNATFVLDAVTRQTLQLTAPVVIVDSFTPEGIQLFISDQGAPLKVNAMKGIQLMIEINRLRLA